MRVAIVGAGIAGIAAGRTLQDAGSEVVLFEKSRGVGGRAAVRRSDGFVWDTGATSITPRGTSLGLALKEPDVAEGLVRIELPVAVHDGRRVSPGDPRRALERYVYPEGISGLAKRLAKGLDVRFQADVDQVKSDGRGYEVMGERFDQLVLTPPIPQTCQLLWSLNESRALAAARYRSCLSIGLGYDLPNPDVHWFAVLEPTQRHPMTWLSLESLKCSGRAPEGKSSMVVQFSAGYSLSHYGRPDEWLVDQAAAYVSELLGTQYRTPNASTVMRWKYSQPTGTAVFEEVNPEGSNLVVASDGLLAGRLEDAYEVGVRAAKVLLRA